jgi:predicted  nucleic acid-binding Zn-ribbon protein
VSLSKIAKGKIKQKEQVAFKPRKIEKIIDVNRLEKKLEEIMALDHNEFSVEERLKALYVLQEIDSNIDKIRTIRGELPMEVADLEDEIVGLNTRITNINEEIANLTDQVNKKKQAAKDSKEQIKKYEAQQDKVKNNREFDSLNKEIEFQNLEIQLAEKRSKEFAIEVSTKNVILEETQNILNDRESVLKLKETELASIVEETKKEEDQLVKIAAKARTIIDERLLTAYTRVRTNARNGLGVVAIQRDACGGCFNKIPPQRQLDIRQHKKVIVCEHCGRILVDPKIADEETVVAE